MDGGPRFSMRYNQPRSSVVFVDWHGVLCHEQFWASILQDERHPHHGDFSRATSRLFADSAVVDGWMRGQISTATIVTRIEAEFETTPPPGYVLARLLEDCRAMKVDPALLAGLVSARRSSFVVIATDNMDPFFERAGAPDLEAATDGILCSAALGVLKADGIRAFFGSWLETHGIDFSRALLLDDSGGICAAFRDVGGAAVWVDRDGAAVVGLAAWLRSGS